MACRKPADYKRGEHTADVLIQAYGCTLEEAFKNAAIALGDLTYFTERVQPKVEKRVVVEYDDLEGLLFRWIDELLFLFEAEKFAWGRRIELSIKRNEGYRIDAVLYGEPYDQTKHGFTGLIVKAMTFHMMEIKQIDDYWMLQYVVDI